MKLWQNSDDKGYTTYKRGSDYKRRDPYTGNYTSAGRTSRTGYRQPNSRELYSDDKRMDSSFTDKPTITNRVLEKLCSKYDKKRSFRTEKAHATVCNNAKFDSAIKNGDYRIVKEGVQF